MTGRNRAWLVASACVGLATGLLIYALPVLDPAKSDVPIPAKSDAAAACEAAAKSSLTRSMAENDDPDITSVTMLPHASEVRGEPDLIGRFSSTVTVELIVTRRGQQPERASINLLCTAEYLGTTGKEEAPVFSTTVEYKPDK